MSAGRPLPLPDELSALFWEAAREHRLAIQRCARCRRWNHAPAILCPFCASPDLNFETVSGRAILYSWTVIRDPPALSFADMLPLIVGVVELKEQPGLLLVSNIIGTSPESLELGLELEVTFADAVAEDVTLPQFRPAKR